jgi:hypothetical protein
MGEEASLCGLMQPSGAEDFHHLNRTTLGTAKRGPKKDMLGEPDTARERSKSNPGSFGKRSLAGCPPVPNSVAERSTRRPRLQAACGRPNLAVLN